MTICINAWLERTSPKITIYNQSTNDTLAIIEGELLDTILTTGEIYTKDLYSSDPLVVKEVVMDLLLIYTRFELNQQINDAYNSVKTQRQINRRLQDTPQKRPSNKSKPQTTKEWLVDYLNITFTPVLN
ncbi:MAG: hypothetical protein KAH22_09590 [Thiotrichaceae bacterium]|nr:hypothetical protein [Thiotrichaceae bacterium]